MTVLGLLVFVWGLSLVVASGGHSSSRCTGFSLSRPLPLRGTGSRRAGSVIVAHGPSCSAARGIFPDQGSNPCPLHWQADSQPLRHQGSSKAKDMSPLFFLYYLFIYLVALGLSGSMQTLSCSMHVGSSPLTRDRTRAHCIGSMESYPLCHQGSPITSTLN